MNVDQSVELKYPLLIALAAPNLVSIVDFVSSPVFTPELEPLKLLAAMLPVTVNWDTPNLAVLSPSLLSGVFPENTKVLSCELEIRYLERKI